MSPKIISLCAILIGSSIATLSGPVALAQGKPAPLTTPALDKYPATSRAQAGEQVILLYARIPEMLVMRAVEGNSTDPATLGMTAKAFAGKDATGVHRGGVALFNVMNANGEVQGFVNENALDQVRLTDAGTRRESVVGAIVLKGRGVIFLESIQQFGPADSTQAPGGTDVVVSTVGPLPNDRGRITAGTAEFAGVTGTFQKIWFPDKSGGTAVELRLFVQRGKAE